MAQVETCLDFFSSDSYFREHKPYIVTPSRKQWSEDLTQQQSSKFLNVGWENHPVTISDARGDENFTLDRTGCQLFSHVAKSLEFSKGHHMDRYWREMETFLLDKLSAELVICYDGQLRKNRHFDDGEMVDLFDPLRLEGPAKGAHDVSFEQAPVTVHRHMSESQRLKYLTPGYRIRIINMWRPLIPYVEDTPLAVCDFQSINASDLVPLDRVYPHKVMELYYIKHRETQKWHWFSKQTMDEVLCLVMYDTRSDRARYCPHTSFENPLAEKDAPKRESVEVRCIVVTKDED